MRLGRAERGGRSRRARRGWEAGGQEVVGVGRCWRVGRRWDFVRFWCLGSGAGGEGAAVCSVGGGGGEAAVARAESLLGVRGLGRPRQRRRPGPPSCAPSSWVAGPARLTDSPAAPFGGAGPRRGGAVLGAAGLSMAEAYGPALPSDRLRLPRLSVRPAVDGCLRLLDPSAARGRRGPGVLRRWGGNGDCLRLERRRLWAFAQATRCARARPAEPPCGCPSSACWRRVPPLSITDPPPRGRRRTR